MISLTYGFNDLVETNQPNFPGYAETEKDLG